MCESSILKEAVRLARVSAMAPDDIVASLAQYSGAMRSALEPFAKEAARLRNYPDDYPYSLPTTPITVGDFRRAQQAIDRLSPPKGDGHA